jgi:hypothetical protein
LPHPKDLLANRPNRPLETNDAPFQIPTICRVPSWCLSHILITHKNSEEEYFMDYEQVPSLLLQLGISAIAAGLLYGLQLLIRDTDSDPDLSKMEVAVRESVAKVGISAGYPTSESMPSLVSFEISDVPKLEESSRALVTWT